MHTTPSYREARRQIRQRRADVVQWRPSESDDESRIGLLLESSAGGLAFVWRGDAPPQQDYLIQMNLASSEPDEQRWCDCVVRHVVTPHDNLCIVGVEVLDSHEFPPTPALLPRPRPTPLADANRVEVKPTKVFLAA